MIARKPDVGWNSAAFSGILLAAGVLVCYRWWKTLRYSTLAHATLFLTSLLNKLSGV